MGDALSVSVVVPTINERPSLERLVPRLVAALAPFRFEIFVVDDNSDDGTAGYIESLDGEGRFQLIHRPRRMGASSAILVGFARTRGSVVVVMDADGSHPPEALPTLIEPIRRGVAEMVVASRRVPGARSDGLQGMRRLMSWGANLLARPLTRVTDPMSGFFALDRRILGGVALSTTSCKIGLEILVKCRPNPVREVPYLFAPRMAGKSKLGTNEIRDYVLHIRQLYAWRTRLNGAAARTR